MTLKNLFPYIFQTRRSSIFNNARCTRCNFLHISFYHIPLPSTSITSNKQYPRAFLFALFLHVRDPTTTTLSLSFHVPPLSSLRGRCAKKSSASQGYDGIAREVAQVLPVASNYIRSRLVAFMNSYKIEPRRAMFSAYANLHTRILIVSRNVGRCKRQGLRFFLCVGSFV